MNINETKHNTKQAVLAKAPKKSVTEEMYNHNKTVLVLKTTNKSFYG